jgi:serine/threonine-protein kinase
MGIVYRARDRRLKRTVAIKVLPPELAFRSEIRSRFLREAETAAQLSHPHIVPIYTVDEQEQLVFFVMAYVAGDNLAKRLHERGVLTIDETRRILRDVADALAYAHERGVVHRDIKPDNILLDASTGRPMVTDFGIARAMDSTGDSRLTATGMAIGTPAYMSPEQAAGEREIDGRSDLYSLGILGYQMLTGEPPFSASSTPAMLVKHISERPVPVEQRRADVPTDLARCIMTLLEKEPQHRFPNASALVAALDTRSAPAPRAAAPSAPPPSSRPAESTTAGSPPPGMSSAMNGGAPAWSQPQPSYAPMPFASTAQPLGLQGVTADELRRWEAPPVAHFRRKLAPFLFVNGVFLLFALFGFSDLLGITVIWSIYIALKYAKLWSDGYDWHDVFRQPRDKELMEVFEEAAEYVRAMFDSRTRARLREERKQRKLAARMAPALPSGLAPGGYGQSAAARSYAASQISGPQGDRVRQALADRDEILRRLNDLPKSQREQLGDVGRSASALADKVQGLALAYEELARQDFTAARDQLEREITTLENAANPLDRGSEDRVRRLAYLKRQRRALVDSSQRKESLAAKIETCAIALQNMRFDLLRLGASPQAQQHITALANQAIKLTENVDDALFVADQMGRMSNERTADSRRAGERG